jgi:radical SAM-linked protein
MGASAMRLVRIRFEKTGRSKYISHLDLTRCMSRALKRAQIPIWYTQGFNPHPYMTFALPLSLGIESLCESMDIKIEGEMQNDQIEESLSKVMPEGISVYSVYDAKMDARKIAFAQYDILLELSSGDVDNFVYSAKALLDCDELIVEKLGKKGRKKVVKQVNLIEHIKSQKITSSEKQVKIMVQISAGSSANINPNLLVDVLIEKIGVEPESVKIIRKSLYTESGEEFL